MLASRYLSILKRPAVARLLGPALAARIPDSIAATAIVVLVRSATGSYSAAGLAAAAFGIGTSVSAPLTGRAVDRLGQRRVLPVLAAAFAGTLIILVLSDVHLNGIAAAVLAAAAGLTRPPIEAALRALWPRLVSPAQADAAYALDSTMQELIWIAGPLLLAVLLAAGSPQLPLIACAVLSIAGTAVYSICLRGVPDGRTVRNAAASPLRQARLRVLLACGAGYGISAGMLNLALVAFAGTHGGVAWAGVLVAVWGSGSLAGGMAYGSRNWKGPVERRAMICLALFGATLMLLAAAPNLIVLALLMVCLGIPLSPWLGSLSAAVQRAAPAASTTEAFAWSFAVITAGMAAGNAVGGIVIQTASTAAAFVSAGGFSLAGALFGASRLADQSCRISSLASSVRLCASATASAVSYSVRKSRHGLASMGRAGGLRERACIMTAQETGTVTGTKDKDYNLVWYVEACLSNALRLETYVEDADREGDSELADLFRKAQADSRKGAEMGKELLRSRLAS